MKGMRCTWYDQQQVAMCIDDAAFEALDLLEQNHRALWSEKLTSVEDQVWIAIALHIRAEIYDETGIT